ncbi:MAG: DUF2953 domain-containing protein [Methanotrichaceae archaeon]
MNTLIIAIILLLIVLLIILLLGPFRLCFNLAKEDMYLQGFYKISFLGFTLKKGEMPSIQPRAAKGILENQEHHEAITPKTAKAFESVDGDRTYSDDNKKIYQKPNRIPPQTQARIIIDAFPQIAQILIDLIKSIDIMKFFCEMSFGLDDPVDTAIVSGYLWSIASATGLYRKDIFIEPQFDGAQLEGSILAVVEARMLWFVVAAVKTLEEKKTRKLIFELVKGEFF